MSLNTKELEKLASLAKILLKENEKEILLKQFNDIIINLIDKVNSIEKKDIEIDTKVIKQPTKLRDDIATSRNSVNDIFKNSQNKICQDSENQYFVVPKIIK